MAVTEAEPKVNAYIYSNGAALQEYDNDEDNDTPRSTTKYVEVTEGSEFELKHQFQSGFKVKHALLVTAFVDGVYGDSSIMKPAEIRFGQMVSMRGRRERIGTGYFLRKFCFSHINTDDGELRNVGDALLKKLKDVGLITVKFEWVTMKECAQKPTTSTPPSDMKIGTIPEKALKGRAMSNQVVLGNPEATSSFETVPASKLYPGKPFATFKFRYRSKKDLQSLLIVPRSPSPVPLEDHDINSLNPEEMRELLKRQKEREKVAKKVKVEGIKREPKCTRNRSVTVDVDDDSSNDEVSFVSSKRGKLAITLNDEGVETIDLT